MTKTGRIVLTTGASLVALGIYYQFGYPLRNVVASSAVWSSELETASIAQHDVFFPSEHELKGKPYANATAALVVDNRTNEMLYAKNVDSPLPVASITKLMSALVLCDLGFDWSQRIQVTREDANNSAKSRLKVGEIFYANDLFYIAMICSDNRAMRALVRKSGVELSKFLDLMNQKARALGMYDSEFCEVTGLDQRNRATASDCARLLNEAIKQPMIADAMTTPSYQYRSTNHKRLRNIVNTNKLLKSPYTVLGGKTGYISASGYCLITRLVDTGQRDVTIVVLGSPHNGTRFAVARKLADWAFASIEKIRKSENQLAKGEK